MLDVAELLTVTVQTDASGTQKPTVAQRRQVYCEVQSVSMRESYKALAIGHNPEVKIVLRDYLDYQSEAFVLFRGSRYKVLRAYQQDREVELTLEKTNDLAGVV